MKNSEDEIGHARAEQFARTHQLLGESSVPRWTSLTGGVSSDLWLLEDRGTKVCIKNALPTLRVAGEWQAPVSRNAVESAWLRKAHSIVPNAVPRVLAADPTAGFIAMEYLEPGDNPVWKDQLMQGQVDPVFARRVGEVLGALHGNTSDAQSAHEFATDTNFAALRLHPYFEVTAERNPDLADRILALRERTAATHQAVIHGDVSPKNILAGPHGPVFLDAECAWYGEPAFDLAFCLTHLVLKSLVQPGQTPALRTSASELKAGYQATSHGLGDAAAQGVAERTATLLPVLLLARVDGLSPVEYLNSRQQAAVRESARALISRAETPLEHTLDVLYGGLHGDESR